MRVESQQRVGGADDALRMLVRHGMALLEALEAVRGDLLTGRIGEGRLNLLLALVGQARKRREPGQDAAIDDIALWVRVELAKRGYYRQL